MENTIIKPINLFSHIKNDDVFKIFDLAEKNKFNIFWLIDPIDGTVNFLHGVPHFATSIALKHENEIVSGLIFDPIKDEMFYAEKNNGAFFNNQRIRVSKKNNLNECLFSTNKNGINKNGNNQRIKRNSIFI